MKTILDITDGEARALLLASLGLSPKTSGLPFGDVLDDFVLTVEEDFLSPQMDQNHVRLRSAYADVTIYADLSVEATPHPRTPFSPLHEPAGAGTAGR